MKGVMGGISAREYTTSLRFVFVTFTYEDTENVFFHHTIIVNNLRNHAIIEVYMFCMVHSKTLCLVLVFRLCSICLFKYTCKHTGGEQLVFTGPLLIL